MARHGGLGRLTRLRYELDAFTLIEIIFPVFMLTLFLLLPVLSTFEAATKYRLSNLLGESYWNPWNPTGQGVRLIKGAGYTRIVVEGWNYGVILNSVINAAVVTLAASILGIIVAFVLARYEFPAKTLLRVMAIVPLLVTPFVNAYVIKKIFGPTFGTNTLSWFLHDILHLPIYIEVRNLAGVTLTQIITFYPIIYLNMFSALLNIDPNLEEQAENLGARGFKLFRTVTLPLALPGLAAGAALVFIFSLEDVGAPIIFGFRDVLSYRIFAYFIGLSAGSKSPEVGALALVMLLIALTVFVGIRQYVSLRQYAMISKGGRWKPRITKPGWKGLLAIYLVVFPIVLFTMLPQLGVITLSLSERWGTSPLPHGFTLSNFAGIIHRSGVFRGIENSFTYSTLAVSIIILVSISVSYVVSRLRIPGMTALDTLATMPIAIPGLVVAYGYFFFFRGIARGTILDPLRDPAIPIILAYSMRRLPFAARSIFAGFSQVHEALDEAAMNLGATRRKVLSSILLPMLLLNIASGTLLSFVYCMGETSVSVTLGGLGGDVGTPNHRGPITMVIYDLISNPRANSIQLAAALGVILMSLQITAIVLITLVFKQSYAFIGV